MVHNKPIPPGNPDDPKHLRLTLRTLLAYLDDVLEPAQAREIGTKIQETPFAAQLVERIQDVLRRRRIAAPDLTGPGSGLDPNTVAEYLDNTLSPESVPDVERVCLESDSHLAEVAACHQILTLVLGEPIHVSAESRERLHALIPQALARQPAGDRTLAPALRETAAASAPPAASRPARETVPPPNGGSLSTRKFAESIPDYLKPKPVWKRALIPTMVVLVLMLWLGLLIYDQSIFGVSNPTSEVAQNDNTPAKTAAASPAAKTAEAGSETSPPEADTPVPPAPGDGAEQTSVAGTETKTEVKTQPEIQIDPDPPGQNKPPGDVVLAKSDGSEPTKVKPVIPAPQGVPQTEPQQAEPEEEKPENAAEAMKPVVPPVPAVEVVYTTKEANPVTKGMLLRYDAEDQKWGALPYRSRVMLGERLACPEPLDAVFAIGGSDCEVTFVGGVLASFQNAEPPAAFGMNLSQGKVLFTRTGSGDESLTIPIQIGQDVLKLELVDPQTRCGLEMLPRLPNRLEQSLGPNWYTGRLWVDSGQVRFADRTGQTHLLEARQALDISPNEPAMGEEPPNPPVVQVDQVLPDWLNPLERNFSSQSVRYMRQIYAAFQDADVESDVTTVLLPLAKSDSTPPAVAVAAARTLAMTGCLRDVADLLSLNEASPEEIRMATIEGCRRWLTLHPDAEHGRLLREELGRNFRKETASRVYRLLWGYRKSDLTDTATALDVVDQLMDDNITVRTLAFLHLQELTGKTNNYRPLDTENQRRTAVNRWRNDVLEGQLFLGN